MGHRTTALLRPGVVLGSYPQREEPRIGKLELAASRLSGFLHQHRVSRASRFEHVIAAVSAYSADLTASSDAQLNELVTELRQQLSREGLENALVYQVFAVVRELAGRTLGMRHFDVQLIGGWIMLQGMIAEMQTGEGKTLTATLAACAAALAGIPVHVITVNDYLVERDAALMLPLYSALGLTVGTITEGMEPEARRTAYACDITYCTNKQLVFDYLKDRLVVGKSGQRLRMDLESLHGGSRSSELLLRGLCFAIVDEADSVLIDEARTPLILSRASDTSGQQHLYEQALDLANQLQAGDDFIIFPQARYIELSERGKARLAGLAGALSGLWQGARRRESLVQQALSASHLFVRDKDYLVKDGKVQIIDEYTGRVMPDRSWEQGLHQMIEARENCEITSPPETLARISYQRFFRRYLRVGGMTGTAREVAGELWEVYRLEVVPVPTHRPSRRQVLPVHVYRRAADKWAAVAKRVGQLQAQGLPVLVGTCSVAASEQLSQLLHQAALEHQVLNARQDQGEADIIAQAGTMGTITVATNMAGRGTDIRLGDGVSELGGLQVIATERHDARRIDRQLSGRCARQGDPGSFESFLSFEDELVKHYPAALVSAVYGTRESAGGALRRRVARLAVALTQHAAERRHSRIRRGLLKMDEQLGDMLAFSGRSE